MFFAFVTFACLHLSQKCLFKCFYSLSLMLATCFFRKKLFNWYTHTSWATMLEFFLCTALCLHNEDDIYSVNECGFLFVCLLMLVAAAAVACGLCQLSRGKT